MDKSRLIKSLSVTLLAIILIAAFLIFIKQFLPFESVDETMIAGFVWDLHRTPFPVNLYPPFFLYLHFLLSLVYKGVLLFLGAVQSSHQFLSTIGLPITVEAARLLNALLGTALVYLVFRLGRKFYNTSVAFLAALLMAFNPLMVLHAHIFKSDILVSLLITLSLYQLFKYLETLKMKFVMQSAFIYGLAVAAKYNVYVFGPIILLALLLTRKELGNGKLIRSAAIIPAVMAAGFFIGAPNWLVHPLGNFRLFLEKYGFGSESVFEPYRIYSAPEIYLKFLSTWITDFGWVFFLILLIAIPVTLITRGKKEILMVSFILIYVILFGFTGFYGDRFSLPLYSSIVILIGKTIFLDIKTRFLGRKKSWHLVATLIWMGTALFLFFTIQNDILTFNLLKTKTKSQWATDYRNQHNLVPQRFHIAFQHMTPRIRGGIKLNASFKLRFYKRHHRIRPDFIQLVNEKYREFIETYDKDKSGLTIDFSQYRPFYLIQKPKIQPWDNDFLFLYRFPKNLTPVPPEGSTSPVLLPRCFAMNPGTSYFPLQTYEKNPAFGKILQGEYHHYIYSRKKISSIRILLFNPSRRYDLSIRVNNRTLRFKKRKFPVVASIELARLKPKKLFLDHVYHLEIKKHSETGPCYFVFWPEGPGFPGKKFIIPDLAGIPIEEPIPRLFSGEIHPPWLREFYKKTGIDLSLLTFINTMELYRNQNRSLQDIKIKWFPLEPGFYTLTVKGSKINDLPRENRLQDITLRLHASGIHEKRKELLTGNTTTIHLEIKNSVHFLEIELKNLRQNNYLPGQITLQPDYLRFINSQKKERHRNR